MTGSLPPEYDSRRRQGVLNERVSRRDLLKKLGQGFGLTMLIGAGGMALAKLLGVGNRNQENQHPTSTPTEQPIKNSPLTPKQQFEQSRGANVAEEQAAKEAAAKSDDIRKEIETATQKAQQEATDKFSVSSNIPPDASQLNNTSTTQGK